VSERWERAAAPSRPSSLCSRAPLLHLLSSRQPPLLLPPDPTNNNKGIGKSIADKLASQGLNVVLVALGDSVLDAATADLKRRHPTVQFRKVGCDLSAPGGKYMDSIVKQTRDLDVQCVFCNAGYILPGFFHTRTQEQVAANVECNSSSAVRVTHHFLTRLLDSNLPGCFVFTSSASAVLPSPFAVTYASTKAFVSMFAASLGPEVKSRGVDVLAVHPSPVASRFYDTATGNAAIPMLDAFKKLAVGPDALPDIIFASVGRCLWKDVGPVAYGFRLVEKVVDLGALFSLAAPVMHLMPDFKLQLRKEQEAKGDGGGGKLVRSRSGGGGGGSAAKRK
jgi:short-subunit dehydrogenase